MVRIYDSLKVDHKSVEFKQKCIDYIENVIYLVQIWLIKNIFKINFTFC